MYTAHVPRHSGEALHRFDTSPDPIYVGTLTYNPDRPTRQILRVYIQRNQRTTWSHGRTNVRTASGVTPVTFIIGFGPAISTALWAASTAKTDAPWRDFMLDAARSLGLY